jgi:hypothetical protein
MLKSSLSLISLQVAMSIVADVYLKRHQLWPGVLIYGLCAIPAYFMFKVTMFGQAWVLWSVVGVVLGVMVATLCYSEPLTARRVASCILAITALILSE